MALITAIRDADLRQGPQLKQVRFGERWTYSVTVRDSSMQPIDLTGWTITGKTAHYTVAAATLDSGAQTLQDFVADETHTTSTTLPFEIAADQVANRGKATLRIGQSFYGRNAALGETEDVPVIILQVGLESPGTVDDDTVKYAYAVFLVRGSIS